jgi:hypothetical protein
MIISITNQKQGDVKLRKLIREKKWLFILTSIIVLSSGLFAISNEAEEKGKSCFYSGLHHTGEGMRYWYEENNGFKNITGIPYEKLDCKSCHVKSCEQCHAVKEGEKCSYSLKKAKDTATCLACHSREKVTFKIGKEKKCLDIHIEKGMQCVDCHKGADVHGDGTAYRTMRDEGAIKVTCEECHSSTEEKSRAHTVHKGKLDCAACHVANTTSCLNCHFDKFLEQGKRKGNFFPPVQDWTILVNYKGKVTSGNVQTLVYQGKKFITYAPYFTHAVQAKARACEDCHGNKAVKRIKRGKSVPMAKFKDNKMISWQGVVPLVPEALHWDFVDKDGDKWVLLKSKEKPALQFSCYAEPFTKEQVKKMAKSYKK